MKEEKDTIVAISTPPGSSGIGIVRMSGTDAFEIAEKLFRSPRGTDLGEATHRIVHGYIAHPGRADTIDEVLVSAMKGPATYTREDTIEINCHGGRIPLRETFHALVEAGARPAEPGEFTKRAFLNGRIDLAQAEAVIDTINAKTARSLAASHRQLKGALSSRIKGVLCGAWDLLVALECNIDFSEEDIPPLLHEEGAGLTKDLLERIDELLATWGKGRILREGAVISLIGRTNVGKSSLLNALTGQDRCIVTDFPGTTRDVIEEGMEIGGLPVVINDTAGIRRPENEAEEKGIAKSLDLVAESELTLFVLDSSEEICEEDCGIFSRLDPDKTIVVLNKSDAALETAVAQAERIFSAKGSISVSAKFGQGLEQLKELIGGAVLGSEMAEDEIVITNARHYKALNEARASLDRAESGLRTKEPEECVALFIKEAIDSLEGIMGVGADHELLDRIFSKFCIGK
ncbi:MAG: tRNA uridine-5-carboxymethylaminomethyl(34) synthesis GTPase MnmE [Actinomycetota bacterium]|nr:tRNA uridine-5-carboxymethylaminomethyl(34) synthesis GTPase MnmE [Actinomycetota bacterium]